MKTILTIGGIYTLGFAVFVWVTTGSLTEAAWLLMWVLFAITVIVGIGITIRALSAFVNDKSGDWDLWQ